MTALDCCARIRREKRTIAVMLQVYCRGQHGGKALCPACRELLEYAERRLERCPFGAQKGACAACPIHCYKPEMRGRVRDVMRYAGPRMIWRHPLLALAHRWDALRHRSFPRPKTADASPAAKIAPVKDTKRAT